MVALAVRAGRLRVVLDGSSTSVRVATLAVMVTKRKSVRRGHEPGDCHDLTFSCYHASPRVARTDCPGGAAARGVR
jgi:hypothetical protein